MQTTTLVFSSALLVSAFAAGCGSVEVSPPCGDFAACSTGAGGSSSTSGTATSGTGGASSTSSTATSSTGVGGGGGTCGGKTGKLCSPTEYCDYSADSCGNFDQPGICKPHPGGCPDLYMPTCACDGKVYGNPCEAANAGADVNNNGGCQAPEGQFSCGSMFCSAKDSYCRTTTSDVGGEPDGYECVTLPAGCGNAATCACVAAEPCGTLCEASGDGGVVVTCPGG